MSNVFDYAFLQEIDYNTVSAPLGSGSAASMMMMDRPLSSTASHSNSAHTNTSELSSGSVDSSSSSSSQVKMDTIVNHCEQLPTRQRSVRIINAENSRSSPAQSPFSARLQQKSSSSSSSVYYYSDTLKKPTAQNLTPVNTKVSLESKNASGSTLVWYAELFSDQIHSFPENK